MATGPRYAVKYRRRREGKTDYRKRRRTLLSGLPRLVIRKSNRFITAQIIEYMPEGDRTRFTVRSSELKKFGWEHGLKNLPAAYLTGFLIGKRALKEGIKKAILDLGLYRVTKGSRLFAVLKGALDAGLEIPHNKKILPDENRLAGAHIAEYLKKSSISKDFETVKESIEQNG